MELKLRVKLELIIDGVYIDDAPNLGTLVVSKYAG